MKKRTETFKLPNITQQPIEHVDGTPDNLYPLRILRAYRENCNCMWSESSGVEEVKNPLLKLMNDQQIKRAEILDKAIAILEKYMC